MGDRDAIFGQHGGRSTDSAAGRKPHQRLDTGRPRNAKSYQRRDVPRPQGTQPLDYDGAIESKLRDDQRFHAARRDGRAFFQQHMPAFFGRQVGMSFRKPADADHLDPSALERTGLYERQTISEWSDWLRPIPGDHEASTYACFYD